MFIEFNVENFRSIKDEITLSMISTSDKSLEGNLIQTKMLKKDCLVRSAVLYGANASGKTNVLLALDFLKKLVLNSHNHQKGNKIIFTPFRLDERCLSKPTRFRIVYIHDDVKYVYSVSFTDEKIIDESLYHYPERRRALIFNRKNTNRFHFTVDKKVQNFLKKRTPDNVLYLSRATQLDYEKTMNAFSWFEEKLQVVGPTDHPDLVTITLDLLHDENMKQIILRALVEADVGIDDITAKIQEIPLENLPGDFQIPFERVIGGKRATLVGVEGVQVHTHHKNVLFNIVEESEGTIRLFSLLGVWINALINGQVLVIDELDTKLHHFLNIFLINLFNDATQNANNAQLLFTTHNTNLLDLNLFRRDQIWFTEKNPEYGNTDLYSLVEFSPRKDKNIQKGYLAGRYGALPFIETNKVF